MLPQANLKRHFQVVQTQTTAACRILHLKDFAGELRHKLYGDLLLKIKYYFQVVQTQTTASSCRILLH